MRHMDEKGDRLRKFGEALDRALGDRPHAWLGKEVADRIGRPTPITGSAVGQWISGKTEPTGPETVFAIEAAVGVKPGTLSRLLGYLPTTAKDMTSVADAIAVDTRLDDDARSLLRVVYDQVAKSR